MRILTWVSLSQSQDVGRLELCSGGNREEFTSYLFQVLETPNLPGLMVSSSAFNAQ